MPSNWPPQPNKPNNSNNNSNNNQLPPNRQPPPDDRPPSGREWQLLEKTLLASIAEQRSARRWRIISKLLTLGTILFAATIMAKGCSTAKTNKLENVSKSQPHLAVVDLDGVISSDKDANSEDISEALTNAFENKQAKAVALRINSPGGSPVQSDDIWQTMMTLKKAHPDKKLYAVIEDMGASGAYYIASAADEIWVNPSSLVGSIGVIMPRYDVQGLMDKAGVKDGTMTAGTHKDILSMSRPMTDFEKAHVQSVLENTHQHFINAVKQGRGDRLKDPEGNQLFTGLFWSGEQAINLGLADKTGSINSLEKQLNVDKIVSYTPQDPMKQLLGQFATQMGHGIGEKFSANMTMGNLINPSQKVTQE